MKKKKQKLWNIYKRTQATLDYARYTRVRNDLRKLTRNIRKNFEKQLASDIKVNAKAFWRYVKSRLKTRQGIEDLITDDGSLATTDENKAGVLSRYFSSVFTIEDRTFIPGLEPMWNGSTVEDLELTPDMVKSKLTGLKPFSSPGADGVHPRVLKELADPLSSPLCALFQKLLDSGEVPEEWKVGEIVPIFKKGSRQDPANYRPVSLTSVISKVLESLVRDRLMALRTDPLIWGYQRRPGRLSSIGKSALNHEIIYVASN